MTAPHALVTGAGSGIGAAIADALAADGARLTLVGRDAGRLATRAASLPRGAATIAGDLAEAAFCDALPSATGPVDLLICNAGAAASAPIARTDDALWESLVAINATAPFRLIRAYAPAMVARGAGRIVVVASTAGLRGYAYVGAYCAAKHAAVGLVRAAALELAATGVTVNAVCPGYTETPLLDRALTGIVEQTGRDEAAARRALLRDNPQGRFVQPAEVASAVAWLCRPEQAAITGRAIPVAGAEVL